VDLKVTWVATGNTTDLISGGTGYSPVLVTLKNAVAKTTYGAI
jgi:hypothetical protein